jgi:DinB superfamily
MDTTPLDLIRQSYRLTHERVLHLVAALSDAQIAWHPTMTTPSVAFHLWHLARWADHLQAAVPGMHMLLGQRLGVRHQIWETDELAGQWQLAHAPLGRYDTGMELDPSSNTFQIRATETFTTKTRRHEGLQNAIKSSCLRAFVVI